ncbi:MAG: ATP-binding protein [Myxococcaceae bacterium]
MPLQRANEISGRPMALAGFTPESTPSAKATIWAVEDSPLLLDTLTASLSGRYQVEGFSDGESLLEAIATRRPDLLLLDWQLPGISGLEVLKFLRGSFDEVSLPVLMLTTKGAHEDLIAGLSAAANDYLTKPYDEPELLARINTLITVRRTAAEAELARQKAKESEELLRMVVEAAGAGTWVLDAKTGRIGADERFRRLFDLHEGETFSLEKGLAIIHPLDSARVAAAVSDALSGKNGGRYHAEYRTRTKAGVIRWVEARGHVAPGQDGKGLRLLGTGIDITGRKRAEAEREVLLSAAERKSEFEQQLIGIVSHDLRNPIAAISMSAALMLRQNDLDPRQRKSLDRIATSAGRVNRMIRDLLDFTQARLGGGLPITRAPMDLHALIRQLVAETQDAMPEREIQLVQSGDGAGSWDSDRVAQVTTNLISNALHYSPASSSIRVTTRGHEADVVLEVLNGGAPIPDSVLPRLFEPMQRGEVTDSTSRSVGLGLYIVKNIVEAHGGSVTVSSNEAQGTTFVVRLPRAR